MVENINRIMELYSENGSKAETSRIICKEMNIEWNDNVRRNIGKLIIKRENKGVFDECESVGIDVDKVKHYWYKGEHYSINVRGEEQNKKELDFDKVISECMEIYNKIPLNKLTVKSDIVDRLVYTDVHTGMDASRNGLSLYPVEWNGEMLLENIKLMAEFTIKNKQSDVLYIDELGDYMDGWDGETTRGGHKLPQNMTNETAFDYGLKAKVLLVDILQSEFKHIVCNNICEDNHSGAFGYVVNSAFKSVIEHKYSNVEVHNHRKFLNFYKIQDRMIVLTHGKDARNLKFGFKPQLDPRQIEKIDQFLKNYSIYNNCNYITFSKGDSHQCLFDMCSSDDFDYFNYPALSPSSEWVQTNFKRGRRGFVLEHIKDNGARVVVEPYFFSKLEY
jgi:hypothetical protein